MTAPTPYIESNAIIYAQQHNEDAVDEALSLLLPYERASLKAAAEYLIARIDIWAESEDEVKTVSYTPSNSEAPTVIGAPLPPKGFTPHA